MDEMEQQAEQAKPGSAGGARVAVLVTVLALAAAPLVYLSVRHGHGAEAAMRVGSAPQQAGDVASLEAAVRANPNAVNRLNLSLTYINAKQPGKAADVARALVAADPKNAAGWNNLCVAEVELQELADATQACEQSLALAPGFQLAKNNLAWAQAEVKAEQDALAKQETVAPGARDREFYLAQGLHEMHLGNYDGAIQSWQKMLLMNTQDAAAANNIGTALMLKHQPKAAEGWFEKAVAWDPSLQLAKNNLAWAQRELPH